MADFQADSSNQTLTSHDTSTQDKLSQTPSAQTPSTQDPSTQTTMTQTSSEADALVLSSSPTHPANLICTLCAAFYQLGWVTGTGGGTSIRHESHLYIAPSGVQKEKLQPLDMFVMNFATKQYLRKPLQLKPSACTPLFLEAFVRGAGCCIHTHSQWAVLVTLLVEQGLPWEKESDTLAADERGKVFEIQEIEQIKGIPRGRNKGMLGYYERLRIPIIENTPHEEDLTSSLAEAMDKYPDTYAVLVRRHGIYVWGDDVAKAKTQCESLDYIFQLAVRMKEHGLPWIRRAQTTEPKKIEAAESPETTASEPKRPAQESTRAKKPGFFQRLAKRWAWG